MLTLLEHMIEPRWVVLLVDVRVPLENLFGFFVVCVLVMLPCIFEIEGADNRTWTII